MFNVITSGEDTRNTVDRLNNIGVQVTTPSKLQFVSFEVSNLQTENRGIVQEVNQMTLFYNTPVPLKAGCKVSYWFPSEFYDAKDIVSVKTGPLYSLNSETYTAKDPLFKFVLKNETDGYKSINFNSCSNFRDQKPTEVSRFVGLRQPLSIQETRTLKIFIRDSRDNIIVEKQSDITFIPLEGSLSLVSASMSTTVVSSLSYFTWTLKPTHSFPIADNPVFKICFPKVFKVMS